MEDYKMVEQNKQKSPLVAILISVIIIAIIVVWAVVKPKPAEPTNQGQVNQQDQPVSDDTATPLPGNTGESSKIETGLKPSLRITIEEAKTWGPAFEPWLGRPAPDFSLTDLTGKQHKLSDYRGKDVMLIFWATWCGPCRMEIPHLIELRKTTGQDKLAMLAISLIGPRNTTEIVKSFLEQNKEINYTVCSISAGDMPAPYNMVNSIPCSFFIDPQGRIKLATIGLLSLKDTKAILQAQ
jgi:thiol-disulfide isomerase/thioredoxin